MEIEIGQIWTSRILGNFVITGRCKMHWQCLFSNGDVIAMEDGDIRFFDLLIENKYAGDWIAAVNSKEFKGEKK